MWKIQYINETSGKKDISTEIVSDEELEQMFKYDAGGIITLKDWKEIDHMNVKIEVLQQGVDLKNGTYKKVAFTGHRPDKLGGYREGNDGKVRVAIRKKLRDVCDYLILNRGTEEFMEGGAQGIDQDAGRVILDIIDQMVQESDGLAYASLHVAVPYPGQQDFWPDETKNYYEFQLKCVERYAHMGSSVEYVRKFKPATRHEAVKWLDERNHYMVDWCDLLIGVWNGTPGGTKNCLDYAKKVGKPILLLKFTITE